MDLKDPQEQGKPHAAACKERKRLRLRLFSWGQLRPGPGGASTQKEAYPCEVRRGRLKQRPKTAQGSHRQAHVTDRDGTGRGHELSQGFPTR